MKVQLGDKLICQKPKLRFFKADPEPYFTSGKVYEVDKILMGNSNGGIPIETLVIYQDNHINNSGRGCRFINNNEILPNTNLGKIFISIKELRKRKLQKIEKYSSKI